MPDVRRARVLLGRLRRGIPEILFDRPAAPPSPKPQRVDPLAELGWVEPDFEDVFRRCKRYTLTSAARMYALWKSVEYVTQAGIPGALVECGVWRGGSALVVIDALTRLGVHDRDLYLFDTYAGMTAPGAEDVDFRGETVAAGDSTFEDWNERYTVGIDDVRRTLHATGYPTERIHLVAGDVAETLPARAPDDVAVLRLDTDWYESTRHEFETLYPRLRPGGVLIVDDYGHWGGARKATDEYLASLPGPVLLNRIDYTGRLAVKPA